jgi:hypothetical protein
MIRCIFLLFALVASPLHAQDAERLAAAQAYVDSPVQVQLVNDLFSPEVIMAQLGLHGSGLTNAERTKIAQIVSDELQAVREDLRQATIAGMAKAFTLQEIEALNKAYSDPLVASAMLKMTPFMQTTMTEMAPSFARMQKRLEQRLKKEL